MTRHSILLATLGACAFGTVSLADFRICNEAQVPTSIAVGYRDIENEIWVTEGWWNLDQGECATPLPGSLRSRYYYVLGDVAEGPGWSGTFDMCTDTDEFTIRGDEACEDRGYTTSLFYEIDTGDARSWEESLTEAGRGSAKTKGSSDDPAPLPSAAPIPQIAADVTLQTCTGRGADLTCSFHGQGFKWIAEAANGSAAPLLRKLRSMPVGTTMTLDGEVLEMGDITITYKLRGLTTTRARTDHETVLAALQGRWQSDEDDSYVQHIKGAESDETYDGEVLETMYLQIGSSCGDLDDGLYLIKRLPEEHDTPYCYTLENWDADVLTLRFHNGAGGVTLTHRKLAD